MAQRPKTNLMHQTPAAETYGHGADASSSLVSPSNGYLKICHDNLLPSFIVAMNDRNTNFMLAQQKIKSWCSFLSLELHSFNYKKKIQILPNMQ
jgi:hypothetical protein